MNARQIQKNIKYAKCDTRNIWWMNQSSVCFLSTSLIMFVKARVWTNSNNIYDDKYLWNVHGSVENIYSYTLLNSNRKARDWQYKIDWQHIELKFCKTVPPWNTKNVTCECLRSPCEVAWYKIKKKLYSNRTLYTCNDRKCLKTYGA